MFECDCRHGFLLHQDGYSCVELNTTLDGPLEESGGILEEDVLYQKDAWFSASLAESRDTSTKKSPERLEEVFTTRHAEVGSTVPPTTTDHCPLGTSGPHCHTEVEIHSPRFSGGGWLAFPALKAAYKHVQLEIEFRPEVWDGILFLTGERDDLAGDFMALLIHQGFVEFRFDCGSGVGVVRSLETVILNQWNRITLYRHRWDAWIQLNSGKHVQGRSKGLFSRMTFREPVFIGGRGNTSGLQDKLPTDHGFKGCIRHLQINDYLYKFAPVPKGDAVKGFDIEECAADRCSKVPCQHGGKCLTSADSAVCLCPLGFTGDLCETRLDLQVPAFNGSSYLRYPGLGSSALSWLDLVIVLKPEDQSGIILYNGHRADGMGDFVALYFSDGHLEFAFDLGTGHATIRSSEPLSMGEWHEVRISRTGRLAVLQVDTNPSSQILSPGAFTQLYLPLNLYIGGVPNMDMVSPKVNIRTSFVGCIQKITINNRPLQILAEALAGVNVNNCPHPCVAKPCGDVAHCVPHYDAYKCVCDKHCEETNDMQTSGRLASFSGNTYLHYTDPDILSRILGNKLSINLRLRTNEPEGMILWTGRNDVKLTSSDFLAVGLKDGYLHLRYNLGSGESLIIFNETRVDDNNWHQIKATRNEQEGSITVDQGKTVSNRSPGKLKQLNTDTGLYIGGMEGMEIGTHYKYRRAFSGCVSELILNTDYRVKLAWSSDAVTHCGDIPP
ncbi:EGF like, fibronectin type III and laminin G domains protein pikachurin isoform X2 [Rhodnius prolixus]